MKWIVMITFLIISCQEGPKSTAVKDEDSSAVQNTNVPGSLDSAQRQDRQITGEMIWPGEGIGKAQIGGDADSLTILFGKPDLSDAAMGKAWLTWNGKRDEHNNAAELNIYTSYSDNTMKKKTVQQIRTTSSGFVISGGLHVYSAFPDIIKAFPAVKQVAYYNTDGRIIQVYDEKKEGIAFEIASAGDQRICIGIIVHQKGKDVMDIYLSLHPSASIIAG